MVLLQTLCNDHPPETDRLHGVGWVSLNKNNFQLNIFHRDGVRFQTCSRLLHLQK